MSNESAARFLIVFDGFKWFVRNVRVIEHDMKLDEKVYRCDKSQWAVLLIWLKRL